MAHASLKDEFVFNELAGVRRRGRSRKFFNALTTALCADRGASSALPVGNSNSTGGVLTVRAARLLAHADEGGQPG